MFLDVVCYQPFEFKNVVVGKTKKEQKTEVLNEPYGELVVCNFLELYKSKKH